RRAGAARHAGDDRRAGPRRRGPADGDDPRRSGARRPRLPRKPPVLEGPCPRRSRRLVRRLLLIGIGAGDPDYLTLQAVRAIDAFDVLFVVTKESATDELVEA